MAPIKLAGLRPQVYEHPSDAAALNALTNTGGFDKFISKLNGWGIERYLRVQLTGSYLRVTPDSFPDLYQLLADVRERLDVPVDIDLYIASGGEINAFTVGVERPLIVLTTAAVQMLSPEELTYVIAHEIGHIKSSHVLYYQIAEFLPVIALLSAALRWALETCWARGYEARCFTGRECQSLLPTAPDCLVARMQRLPGRRWPSLLARRRSISRP